VLLLPRPVTPKRGGDRPGARGMGWSAARVDQPVEDDKQGPSLSVGQIHGGCHRYVGFPCGDGQHVRCPYLSYPTCIRVTLMCYIYIVLLFCSFCCIFCNLCLLLCFYVHRRFVLFVNMYK